MAARKARGQAGHPTLFVEHDEDPASALARHLGSGALVAGIDEAGRGPLAGPVVAAACVLPEPLPAALLALDDSKRLTEAQRAALRPLIVAHALGWGVATVEAPRIDEINILRASLEAMARALEACERMLQRDVAGAVVDGNMRAPLPARIVQHPIVGGDGRSRPIMAASILAKVARDQRMVEEGARHPGYGFAEHKGYGTPAHLEALKRLGPCAIHRRSFAPVRAVAAATSGQPPAADAEAHDVSRTARGRAGEDLAVLHLEREGYVVLERNVRRAGGEIDIVAREGDVLCFVEVRRRRRAADALESVSLAKRGRLVRAAQAYLQRVSPTPRCRFDVVAVAGKQVHVVRAAFEAAP